ncbi:MAG: GNAT family N-acetyltransferase [Candidatus Bipolaricaulaceae bacterium]
MWYGQRVRLRAIEREDIPTFVRWFNDPRVRQYLLMYEPMSKAKEERWFDAQLQREDEFLWAIEARADGDWIHIGNLGLHKVDWKNRNATFGIVLGEVDYWGKGYGLDATCTLLQFAFGELGLHRVELEVFAGNERARRCYERAGFRREGTRRQALHRDGNFHDVHLMAILRDEFQGQQRKAR